MKKAPYSIIYEDDKCLVVYKERDVLAIRTNDKKTFSHNLYHYIYLYLKKKNERPFIVHRLDFETSGIMIFAKSENLKNELQSYFENRTVKRYYECIIKEKIPLNQEFTVKENLSFKNEKVFLSEEGKDAITIFKSMNYTNIGTALKVEIKTGRHNQIRMAVKNLGYTLLGDKRYSSDINKRMYLNFYHLEFPKECSLNVKAFIVKPLWIIE